jgi:hypothetical protein
LQLGKISRDIALSRITSKTFDKVTLFEYIDDWQTISASQRKKYRVYANAIKTRLKEGKYSNPELPISHLNSIDDCKKISIILKKSVSGNEYFNMLDRITKVEKMSIKKPFQEEGLKNKGIKRNRQQKKQLNTFDIIRFKTDGVNNITTNRQLMSYLWWLYSFCLQGMDGADLASLDENSFKKYSGRPNEINHYHPEGNSIQSKGDFSGKHYVLDRRKKSLGVIAALYNISPILVIRDWIHYLIGVTYPKYQYKGKDRVKLFSFDLYDSDGKPNEDVIDGSWKEMRDIFRSNQQLLFGSHTKKARHEFTMYCINELGLDSTQTKLFLGQYQADVALGSYLPTNPKMVQRDIQQMEILQKFGVIKLVWFLYKRFSEMEDRGVKMLKVTPSMFVGLRLLEGGNGTLLSWSTEKEKRYQDLLNRMTLGSEESYRDEVTGTLKQRFKMIPEDQYPVELKELHIERLKSSLRIPQRLMEKKLTQDIIDNNLKIGKELKELGYDVNFE